MKKLLRAAVVFILTISTAATCFACGNGNKGERVVFWTLTFQDHTQEYLSKKVKQFNAEGKGYYVDIRFYGTAEYHPLIASLLGRENVPDIFFMHNGAMYDYYVQDYFAPLGDYFTEEELDDIVDFAHEYLTFDGKTIAYPWSFSPNSVFFYRKSWLKNAGFNIPTDNIWTWDDLLKACAAVKPKLNKGQYALGFPLGIEANTQLAGIAYNATGADVLSYDWTQCNLELNQDWRDFYGMIYDLYKGGYFPPDNLGESAHESWVPFCENKLAMTFCGSWLISGAMNFYPEIEADLGVAVMPTRDGDITTTTAINGGWNYAIHQRSQNKEKAAEFIKWMMSEQNALEYFEIANYGDFPSLKSLTAKIMAEKDEFAHPDWIEIMETVTKTALPQHSYSQFVLTEAFGTPVDYIILNINQNKATVVDKVINDARTRILATISSTGWPTNPQAK